MAKKKLKKLPAFKNVEEESDFWDNNSLEDFPTVDVTEEFLREIKNEKIDISKLRRVGPDKTEEEVFKDIIKKYLDFTKI